MAEIKSFKSTKQIVDEKLAEEAENQKQMILDYVDGFRERVVAGDIRVLMLAALSYDDEMYLVPGTGHASDLELIGLAENLKQAIFYAALEGGE